MRQTRPAVFLSLVISCAFLPALHAGEDKDFNVPHHLYTLGEFKDAATGFDKYLAAYPASERASEALRLLAECHFQLKDYPQSAALFEKFLATVPSSPHRAEVAQRVVRSNFLNKAFDKSLAAAELFIKENQSRLGKPDSPPALPQLFAQVLYYAGESAYAAKKPEDAKRYWSSLSKDFADSKLVPDAQNGLAWLAFNEGQWDAAAKGFQATAAKTDHPKAAESQLMYARALDKLNKRAEALTELDKVAALPEGAAQKGAVTLWRAVFLANAGKYTEALAGFRALLKDFPDNVDAPVALALAVRQALENKAQADAAEFAALYLASFPKGVERGYMGRVRANSLNATGKAAEALAAAKEALKESEALPAGDVRNTERPASLLLVAELSGKDSVPYYESVAKEFPGTPSAWIARYQLCYWAGKDGRAAEGLAQAEALLKELKPGDPLSAEIRENALFAAADFAFILNDRAKAEALLKEYMALASVQKDPAGKQADLARLRLAWCVWERDPATAARELDAALAANPRKELRGEMLYLRGSAMLKNKDEAKALFDFKTLLDEKLDPHFGAHAAFKAGQTLAAEEKYADALGWLTRLLEGDATGKPAGLLVDGRVLRAQVYLKTGKPIEALADTELLLAKPEALITKTDKGQTNLAPTVRLIKAYALEAVPEKAKDAEAAFSALIDAGPKDAPEIPQALYRRAALRVATKRFADAKPDLEAFLASKPPDAMALDALLLLSASQRELKDLDGAKQTLERAAKLPLSGRAAFEVPFQLGHLAYEANKLEDAAANYKKALDAAATLKDIPASATAAAALDLGWALKRAGKPKDAEAAFADAVKREPAGEFSAEARYQCGALRAEAGDTEGALAAWKELLDKNPQHALAEKALAGTGAVLAKANRGADAAAAFDQYLAKYPKGAQVREIYAGLGEMRALNKDADGARKAFLSALGEKGAEADLDEVGERAILGLAELALAKAQAAEAKKLALRLLTEVENTKWLDAALLVCGKASEELNEPEKAIGYYRKLVSDRPQSPRVQQAKDRLKVLGAEK